MSNEMAADMIGIASATVLRGYIKLLDVFGRDVFGLTNSYKINWRLIEEARTELSEAVKMLDKALEQREDEEDEY